MTHQENVLLREDLGTHCNSTVALVEGRGVYQNKPTDTPRPYLWHGLRIEKCDGSTGDSVTFWINEAEPKQLDELAKFFLRASTQVAEAQKDFKAKTKKQ